MIIIIVDLTLIDDAKMRHLNVPVVPVLTAFSALKNRPVVTLKQIRYKPRFASKKSPLNGLNETILTQIRLIDHDR